MEITMKMEAKKNQYKITVDIQGYILSWSSNNIVGATKLIAVGIVVCLNTN